MELVVEAKRRRGSRITIEWQFLVHRYNEHEVEEARAMAQGLGVFFRPSPLRGMEFHPDLQDEWLGADPAFAVAREQPGDVVNEFPCYFLWRSMVLGSSGTLTRCPIYENTSAYASALTGSMLEAYNSPATQRARQLFAKGSVDAGDFPSPCANCSFFRREHGGAYLDKHESLGRGAKPAGIGAVPVSGEIRRRRRT
jgi:hypothetical protein